MAGRQKEQWGTKLGVVLAVAGSAVGLGNFLRFPGQAALNGGGAFMIPYFISMILIGIPICWAEWSVGRYGGRFGFSSCPAIMGVLGRHAAWRYLGVLGVLIPVVIYMYYVLIEAWCLGYAWSYLTGKIDLGQDPERYAQRAGEFFGHFVGIEQDGVTLAGGLQISVVFWIIVFALNFVLIYRGVSKGIEAFCIRAMPLMALCALLVLVRVLTLPPNAKDPEQLNVLNGLGYMWNPKPVDEGQPWWAALANADVWLAAAGQIFFSLSVGFGIILNYASYVRRNQDIVLSGLTAASTNEFFEVCLGGLITIPAAFVFLGATGVGGSLGSSFALGFNTLPAVFEYMPLGRAVGFTWFFMLFLAAITSSLSMLQPAIAFLEEGLGIGRRGSVTLLGLITALGSFFVIYFSKNLVALDTFDFWVGNALIFVAATILVILVAWVFGAERAYAEAHRSAALRIPRVWKFVIKYISPTYLLTIFILWCCRNLPDRVRELGGNQVAVLAVLVLAAIIAFLLVMVNVASRRWGDPRRHVELPEEQIA